MDSIEHGYNTVPGGGLGGNAWKQYMYNGTLYSVEELLQFSTVKGLTTHDITTRIGRGWDITTALSKPKIKKNLKFEYNKKMYSAKELAELSNIDGITARDIFNRIHNCGWTVERAITQPKNVKLQPHGCRDKNKECKFKYDGKIHKSYELKEKSCVEDITTHNITNRINQLGWDIDKALTKPKKKYNQLFEYKGKYYTSKELAKISKLDNITHNDITDRINRNGWSVERAITQPKRKSPIKK